MDAFEQEDQISIITDLLERAMLAEEGVTVYLNTNTNLIYCVRTGRKVCSKQIAKKTRTRRYQLIDFNSFFLSQPDIIMHVTGKMLMRVCEQHSLVLANTDCNYVILKFIAANKRDRSWQDSKILRPALLLCILI